MAQNTTKSTPNVLSPEAIAAMSPEQMAKMLLAVANNQRKALDKDGKLNIQVSQKGAFSLYGLGRMPVTLYASQWERLVEVIDGVKAYIDSNASNPLVSRKTEDAE